MLEAGKNAILPLVVVEEVDPARREELARAYRATTYAAAIPLRLRLGEPNPLVDALLDDLGASRYAFLTAWNPGAKPRSEAENREAQQRLMDALEGRPVFVGAGEADDGSWPPEPSLLVVGLACDEAVELGRRFGQVAIVVGEKGGAPQLVWL